jgi:CMP-2-keto-3-deoxyoctulosonic acid synthetase
MIRIFEVQLAGGRAVMTSSAHPSDDSRIMEVVESSSRIIANVQRRA